jgi:putative endonuclease
VDLRKQRRLAAAAQHYLQAHPSVLPCRFDVVAISGSERIEWLKNAFDIT